MKFFNLLWVVSGIGIWIRRLMVWLRFFCVWEREREMRLFLLFLALYESVRVLALHFYREWRSLRVLKIAKPSLRLFLINPYTLLPSPLKPIQLYPNNQHKYTQSNPYLTNPSSIPFSISSLRLIFMGLDICMSMSMSLSL